MTSSEAKRSFTRLVLAAALASPLLVSGEAHAQRTAADIESARQAYNDGIALRDKGDLKGALEKFRAAHALGNTPITGLELCRTYAVMGQPVEARETCLGVARIPPQAAETGRSQEARAEAARLADDVKPKIAQLELRITNVPPGREPTVTVDGVAIPAVALGSPRAVNPGVHVVVAKVGSGGETKATFEAREGQPQVIELAVQPPPPEDTGGPAKGPGGDTGTKPAPPKKSSGVATFGFIVAGSGAAIGLLAGGVALAKKGSLDDACPNQQCGREQHDALDSARTWGNVSTAFFVIGGVGLGIGILGSLSGTSSKTASTPPKSASARPVTWTPVLGLGGAGVHGTF